MFCAATDGKSIAFGTVANGLFVKNLSDNSTLHVNTFSGMQNNTVLSVGFDRSGNLWLGLDKGIDYVVINTPEFSLFGSENLYGSGYASLVYKENCIWVQIRDSIIWTIPLRISNKRSSPYKT